MAQKFKAPYYSYEDLRNAADEFLREYHPQGTILTPIEEIVEFQLGMDIVPIPGLHDVIETDGFTTSDLREIHVEEYLYDHVPNRYRFTLAHEVGHVILHGDLFRTQSFHSIAEWKAFLNSIPEREHGWLESHAYSFAGLVLVPREHLEKETRQCVDTVLAEGVDFERYWHLVWQQVAAELAQRFAVSAGVIERRLRYDDIPNGFVTGGT